MKKFFEVLALAVLVLLLLHQLFGTQIFYLGRYLTQEKKLVWNGLDLPISKPLALFPGYDDKHVVFMLFNDSRTGIVHDVGLLMRADYDQQDFDNLHRYCQTKSKECKEGTRLIAGHQFNYVIFTGTFTSIGGDYHAHFLSASPPLTINYHGDRDDYRYFDEFLARIKSIHE